MYTSNIIWTCFRENDYDMQNWTNVKFVQVEFKLKIFFGLKMQTTRFPLYKNANARTSHCMQYIHDSLRI